MGMEQNMLYLLDVISSTANRNSFRSIEQRTQQKALRLTFSVTQLPIVTYKSSGDLTRSVRYDWEIFQPQYDSGVRFIVRFRK
jgi:hypothetical protein